MSKTVKARIHHGAESLNLTIPAEVVKENNINDGDIFEIDITKKDEDIVLKYRRVYQSE